MLEADKDRLDAIAKSCTARFPQVVTFGMADQHAFFVLEMGRALATLCQSTAPLRLAVQQVIGATIQISGKGTDKPHFYDQGTKPTQRRSFGRKATCLGDGTSVNFHAVVCWGGTQGRSRYDGTICWRLRNRILQSIPLDLHPGLSLTTRNNLYTFCHIRTHYNLFGETYAD